MHAYLQAPNGRTAYLSELSSGAEVLVVDAAGRTRTAVVGRIKLEARPLVSKQGSQAGRVMKAGPDSMGIFWVLSCMAWVIQACHGYEV